MRRLAVFLWAAWLAGGWLFPAVAASPEGSVAQAASPGQEARQLLRAQRVGMLATQSVALRGFPFASLTPYALDAQGRPLILISALSQHTLNIRADDRVSLLVYDAAEPDVHDAARLTWIGRAVPVPEGDARARTAYMSRFPAVARFLKAHDFALYRLEPVRGYYIGGFGKIFWLEPRELVSPAGA